MLNLILDKLKFNYKKRDRALNICGVHLQQQIEVLYQQNHQW